MPDGHVTPRQTRGTLATHNLRPATCNCNLPPAPCNLHTRSLSQAAALLALLLLAFALRVYALDAQSLWYDEAVTAQVAQQGLGELAQWTADDIQPPLYYALVAGWTRLAGTGEWALRFPSVAFGLVMVALAYVLGRRLFGRAAGWVAALLGALHPLWVYYAQEARMYTLLTALGMLAGYALLRVLASSQEPGAARQRLTWWAAFVGASIALLYTHYFAAFLLLAFALFFVLALAIQAGRKSTGATMRRLLVEGAVAGLLVVVAYLPWLPNALRRFQVDASYWQGTLKLDEAIRHIAISFTTGETVLEQQAIPLAWGMALLAGVCLVALAWTAVRGQSGQQTADQTRIGSQRSAVSGRRSAVRGRRSSAIPQSRNSATCNLPLATLFVTLYLLVPIIAILLLSYRTPKFNPRYLMLASPALVLLLAGGLTLPFTGRSRRSFTPPNRGSRLTTRRRVGSAGCGGRLSARRPQLVRRSCLHQGRLARRRSRRPFAAPAGRGRGPRERPRAAGLALLRARRRATAPA